VAKRRKLNPNRLTPQDPEVLSAPGAARLLGVSERLVLRLAREGKLPARKLGREWRFNRAALLRSLAEPDLSRPLGELLSDPRVKVGVKKR